MIFFQMLKPGGGMAAEDSLTPTEKSGTIQSLDQLYRSYPRESFTPELQISEAVVALANRRHQAANHAA